LAENSKKRLNATRDTIAEAAGKYLAVGGNSAVVKMKAREVKLKKYCRFINKANAMNDDRITHIRKRCVSIRRIADLYMKEVCTDESISQVYTET
jgi:hypothetical protein